MAQLHQSDYDWCTYIPREKSRYAETFRNPIITGGDNYVSKFMQYGKRLGGCYTRSKS
jgi:hypothetical protein